ncbi:MAG: hypothetical protein Fur0022_41690 [Anaerolineales bacterium]
MKAYINYPNPHITIHRDPDCSEFHKNRKKDQRTIHVSLQNIKTVLRDFIEEKYRFATDQSLNDLWLDISLDTAEQEMGLVYIIQALIGLRYTPIKNAQVIEHYCLLHK